MIELFDDIAPIAVATFRNRCRQEQVAERILGIAAVYYISVATAAHCVTCSSLATARAHATASEAPSCTRLSQIRQPGAGTLPGQPRAVAVRHFWATVLPRLLLPLATAAASQLSR